MKTLFMLVIDISGFGAVKYLIGEFREILKNSLLSAWMG